MSADVAERVTRRRSGARAPAPRRAAGPAVVLGLLVLAWAGLALVVARSPHDLNNIDGISYISIAQQYADGDVRDAVNAYWSPLISWLAAPLIALGVDGIVAVVAASALGAAAGLGAGTLLLWRLTRGNAPATAAYVIGAGAFYVGATRSLTPDVLVVAWTTLFVAALVRLGEALEGGRHVRRDSAVLGVVCALGYVTKLFLVPVVVVSLALWAALRWWHAGDRAARRRVLAATATAALVAAVLAAPWATALSLKYGHPTIGSSFSVNMSAKVDPVQSAAAPVAAAPLWAPPNEHAVSFGEDRTFQVTSTEAADDVPVAERLSYYVEQRVLAFPHYLQRIASVAPWAVVTMAVLVLALVLARRRAEGRMVGETLAVVFWVYFLGYAGVTTAATEGGNARYYWPLLTLSLLAACWAAPLVRRRLAPTGDRWRTAVCALVVALVPATAVWQHTLGHAAPFSTLKTTSGVAYLAQTPQPPSLELLADALAPTVPEGSAIMGTSYRSTLRLAYYLDAQVYGRASQGYDITDPGFQQRMRDAGIDYYLMYTPVGVAAPDVSAVGDVVASVTADVACTDAAATPLEPCVVDVIRVDAHDG